jgi:hypothetical protein
MMEKLARAGEGWGLRPLPLTIVTIMYKVAVYAPAERADTLPQFLYPYVLCGWKCKPSPPPSPFSKSILSFVLDAGRRSYSHPEQNVAEAEKQDDKAETSRASEKKARHEKNPLSDAAERIKDVFKTDESIVAAGPYHTVRAGRQALMSGEMKLMGNVKRDAAREAGFCLAGDSRIKQAHLRHRLDVMLNMSMSFDPATMMCTGCKVGRLQC